MTHTNVNSDAMHAVTLVGFAMHLASFKGYTMTNVTERINAATLADAQAWAATNEKFTFCIDFLEISAQWSRSDHWVDQLELVFEGLIEEERALDERVAAIKAGFIKEGPKLLISILNRSK